jgi:hypothetical protein
MRFAEYDPVVDLWTPLPTPPLDLQAPFTASSTFVWTGKELIVWGFNQIRTNDSSGSMQAMGYRPATRQWRALPSPPIIGLIRATPIWTGEELLVWGANTTGDAVPVQAAAYSPRTDTWTSLPVGPLHAREDPVAVWTGSEMIVWGGLASPPDPAEGAAFNPKTNTWRVLPNSGLSTREGASIVWAGQRLLVWSGYPVGGTTQDGADGVSYDPIANQWQPIASAPIGNRSQAATLWTGTAMLVWGGQSNHGVAESALANGALYDPSRNEWTLLPPAPLRARWAPAAAWTTNQALIVGGYGPEPFRPETSASQSPVELADAVIYRRVEGSQTTPRLTSDPCALLTPSEVAAAAGVQAQRGERHAAIGEADARRICSFTVSTSLRTVIVYLRRGGPPLFDGERLAAASPSGTSIDSSGATAVRGATYVSVGAQFPGPTFGRVAEGLLELAMRRAMHAT